MRILLVLENAGAGSGRHVLDLATGLLRRRHTVALIYATGRSEPSFEDAACGMAGLDRTRIAMVRGPHPSDLRAYLDIRRYLKAHDAFDVIHGHSSKGGALARLAGRPGDAVIVYTPHAFFTLDPGLGPVRRTFYTTLERLLAWRSDGIICVSGTEKTHALELGIPERLLFEVHNRLAPLPPARREWAREAMNLASEHVCIGFVGRLAPQKAVERLVRAFGALASEQRDARLVIVGSGPDEAALRELSAGLGLDDRVHFAGQADGPALMAGFDIFALPSRYEAFPYVLLEAADRGLPIVTTLVGGAREIVRDGVNGFVVAQDSLHDLTHRLRELCADPGKRAALGRASRAALGSGVDEMVDGTVTVYEQLLQRRRRHR